MLDSTIPKLAVRLVLLLRENDFPVGVLESLRIALALAAGDVDLSDARQIGTVVACIVSKSSGAQTACAKLVAEWYSQNAERPRIAVRDPPSFRPKAGNRGFEREGRSDPPVNMRRHLGMRHRVRDAWLAVGLFLIAAAAYVAVAYVVFMPVSPEDQGKRQIVIPLEMIEPVRAVLAMVFCGLVVLALWLTRPRGHISSNRAEALPPRLPGEPTPRDGATVNVGATEEWTKHGGSHSVSPPRKRLAIKRTVEATARSAGLPKLMFDDSNETTWIWSDETLVSRDPSRHFSQEILAWHVGADLQRSAREVRRARFWGIPDPLCFDGRQQPLSRLRPSRCRVLVLTDGFRLKQPLSDQQKASVRRLSDWPELEFVDVSCGEHDLRSSLRCLQLRRPVKEPDEILRYGTNRRNPLGFVGASRAWAAACALTEVALTPQWAIRLLQDVQFERKSLRLAPWDIESFPASASVTGGAVWWRLPQRVQLLSWLEAVDQGEKSVREIALAFWRKQLDRFGSMGSELEVEAAVLKLWTEPDVAAELLGELRNEHPRLVQRRVAEFAPKDSRGASGGIGLPWALEQWPGRTQLLLQELGLGSSTGVRHSGLHSIAMGIAVGLVVCAIISFSVWR